MYFYRLKPQTLIEENQIQVGQLAGASQLGELYKSYHHLVFGLALHYLKDKTLAEDAVMDIFEALLRTQSYTNIESFKPWVLKVTRNHCLKKIERCLIKNKWDELEEKHLQIMENQAELDDNHEVLLNKLEILLTTLTPPQQQCISLFYYKKMSYSEIVAQTDFSMKEVKSYLQNAREKLKRQMVKSSKN